VKETKTPSKLTPKQEAIVDILVGVLRREKEKQNKNPTGG